MPRIWGWLALAPLAAATGCTAVLGDFSQTTGVENDDAGDGSVATDTGALADATQDATSDAKLDVSIPDVSVPDAPPEAGCVGTVATVTPGGNVSYCPGVGVDLTASTAAVYAWSTGATTPSITVMDPGTYSVTTIDSRGCRATSSAVTAAAYPAAAVPTITSTATSFCVGSNVTLTASSAASYEWSTGATTQSTIITAPGTYTVTTKDANGCAATSAGFTVTEITPPPGSMAFAYTGVSQGQAWTVPQCVSTITVDAAGGQGGSNTSPYTAVGGMGGRVQATLAVTPGQLLTIFVGGAGFACTTKNSGGTNGYDSGGYAICPTATSTSYPEVDPYSGTGGAATDIRVSPNGEANRLLVAGGGGGAGWNYLSARDNGGAGGGLTGAPGGDGTLTTTNGVGLGGSQTAGGAPGLTGVQNTAGGSGSQGYGGSAYCYESTTSPAQYPPSGGGGGGGWYGGGSGCWGAAGGGSSYVNPALGTNITHTQGFQSGNGYLKINW